MAFLRLLRDGWTGLSGSVRGPGCGSTFRCIAGQESPARRALRRETSALDRGAQPRAAQEEALEQQEQDDRDEARDRQRGDEDAEIRGRLECRQADRQRLEIRLP